MQARDGAPKPGCRWRIACWAFRSWLWRKSRAVGGILVVVLMARSAIVYIWFHM
jgi:hypothetical protein